MIRKILSVRKKEFPKSHSKRNHDIQRIETFSDGVFAFAVTLLIVSLEVPHTFEELLTTMRGFFAFGISFLILFSIWNEQHRFFRTYGLDDYLTLALNGMLLFIVLFYVYPLKFLFSLMFSDQIYGLHKSPFIISQHQTPTLMIIYGLGFLTIYLLFMFMYEHAFRKSKELGLSSAEKFACKTNVYRALIMVSIALVSIIMALMLSDEDSGFAGFAYFLIGPAFSIFYTLRNKLRRKQNLEREE